MRTTNAFAFRPSVETLADRTMPSVSPVIGELVLVKPHTTVHAGDTTHDVVATVAMKWTAPAPMRKAGGGQPG